MFGDLVFFEPFILKTIKYTYKNDEMYIEHIRVVKISHCSS